MFAASIAKTGAFQLLAVEALEVAIRVVIIVLALRALEADEVILAHGKTQYQAYLHLASFVGQFCWRRSPFNSLRSSFN